MPTPKDAPASAPATPDHPEVATTTREPLGAPSAPRRLAGATGAALEVIGARLRAAAERPVRIRPRSEPQPLWPDHARWLIERTIPEARRVRLETPELAARVKSHVAYARTRAVVREPWVVWRGKSRQGKTSLACAALIDAIDRGLTRRPEFIDARALAASHAVYRNGESEAPLVTRALEADLLLLDDLGSEPADGGSSIDRVIADREARGARTWITTWMQYERGEPGTRASDRYGIGIAHRIFERATVIEC